MKKIVILIVISMVSLVSLCACKRQTMTSPEYPLTVEAVEEALQEQGLSYTLQEDEQVREINPDQSLIVLYGDEKNKFAIGISSGRKDEERVLFLSFPDSGYTNAITLEECEDVIGLAARLYGGFEDHNQVYDSFIRNYDVENGGQELVSYWNYDIHGVECQIRTERSEPDSPGVYVRTIIITNDLDLFFPEHESKEGEGTIGN